MRANITGITFTIFMLILLTLSCNQKTKVAESKDNDIKFDTITTTKFHYLNNDSTLPSCNLSINVSYPSAYEDKDVLMKLKSIFTTTIFDDSYANMKLEEAIEKYSKTYIDNYIQDAKYYFDESSAEHGDFKDRYFSYYEKLSNEIKFNKGNILSVQFMCSNKKSNNNTFRQYSNKVIDLSTGNILHENNIFKEDYEKFLSLIFRNKLLETNNVKNISELEELGYFGIEEMMPNNNFLVNNEGITYVFNKGEYSVLKADEITLFIPYDEISEILKEESPLSVFYN